MKDKLRRCAAIIGSLVFVGSLSACAFSQAQKRAMVSTRSSEAHKAFVRKVDFSQAPEMKELAERARQIGNEVYPKVLALLADDNSKLPQRFDIVFKKHLIKPNQVDGRTQGTRIRLYLDTKWFAKNPAVFDMLLIHEMARLTQGTKWYRAISRKSPCWGEGIADYVRYKLGYINGWRCPQCSVEFPHYTYGYPCAGAFLLFLDATYGSNVVRQLNTEVRRRTYSDTFFARATGKGLDELWVQFQKTPAFTPVAAEVDKLYYALGYVSGKPPKDVLARFTLYLIQHGRVDELQGLADELKVKTGKDVLLLHALYQYIGQPTQFLSGLLDKDQLPGFSASEVQGISFRAYIPPGECESWDYPLSRTLTRSKKGDTYHYLAVQESEESAWKLQKAWRTDSNERVVEQYSVPRE